MHTYLILATLISSHGAALSLDPPDHSVSLYNHKQHLQQQQISYRVQGSLLVLLLDDPMLELKHNPKTGGSFVINVLGMLLQKGKVHTIPEFTPSSGIADMPQTSAFKIGMIREPCAQYKSLWSYCVLGKRGRYGLGEPACAYAPSGPRARIDDVGLFREFVKTLVSDDDKIGLVTCRTHYNYINRSMKDMMEIRGLNNACGGLDGVDQMKEAPGEAILESFARGNAMAAADCWLHTETLEQDLRKCLEMFERRTGQTANLDSFDRVVARAHEIHDNSVSEHLGHDGFEGESVQPCSFYLIRKLAASLSSMIMLCLRHLGIKDVASRWPRMTRRTEHQQPARK